MARNPALAHPPHGHRPPWRWAVLGAALGLGLAAVLGAPAHWLAHGVAWASGQRVLLQNARGTVWSGSAQLVLSAGAGTTDRRGLPSRVHWRWGLAWPGLSLQISSACCTPAPLQLQLQADRQGVHVQLQDQHSHWPVALLAGLGAPWNTIAAEGRIDWRSQGLQLRTPWPGQPQALLWHGQTELQLQELSSRLSTLRPMGSYQLLLQGTPTGTATPHLNLRTLQGPLLLQGQGQWLQQRLRFAGEAWAQDGAEAALANLLNVIGRREGSRSLLSMG